MPPQELVIFIAVLFKSVPIVIAGAIAVMLFTRSTLGKAVIQRLQENPGDPEALAVLQADLEEMRRELGDVQERLDFAERRLVQSSPPPEPFHSDDPSPPEPVTAQ
jgi:hypothetical protein